MMPIKSGEKFLHVNPRGGFLGDSSALAKKPTTINFQNYGFKFRNIVGLTRTGALDYGDVFQDNISSLWMKTDFDTREIFEGDQYIYDLSLAAIGYDTYKASFGPDDSYYPDNSDPIGDYGVVISYPNSKPPHYSGSATIKISDTSKRLAMEVDSIGFAFEQSDLQDNDELQGSFLFLDERSKPISRMPQYRGWYENNQWVPSYSTFLGRPGQDRKGVDIFAMTGTVLASPIAGKVRVNPFAGGQPSAELGNSVVIDFKYQSKAYFVVFAHLDNIMVANGQTVKKGQPIGRTGCTGNAGSNLPCDYASRNIYGGRSDHVHIDVRSGLAVPFGPYADPIAALNLSVMSPP